MPRKKDSISTYKRAIRSTCSKFWGLTLRHKYHNIICKLWRHMDVSYRSGLATKFHSIHVPSCSSDNQALFLARNECTWCLKNRTSVSHSTLRISCPSITEQEILTQCWETRKETADGWLRACSRKRVSSSRTAHFFFLHVISFSS